MGTNEYSQPASKSSWDSQDFGDVNMVLKMAHFHESSRPQWVNSSNTRFTIVILMILLTMLHNTRKTYGEFLLYIWPMELHTWSVILLTNQQIMAYVFLIKYTQGMSLHFCDIIDTWWEIPKHGYPCGKSFVKVPRKNKPGNAPFKQNLVYVICPLINFIHNTYRTSIFSLGRSR